MNAKPAVEAESVQKLYRVGDLLIDVGRGQVTRAAVNLAVTGLSFDVLLALIKAAPNLVSSDELINRAWSGAVVSPETVIQRVKMLRQSLGDDAEHARYIATVRGRGYRLLPKVEPLHDAVTTPLATPGASDHDQSRPALRRLRLVWAAAALLVAALVVVFGFVYRNHQVPAVAGLRADAPVSFGPRTAVAVLPFVNLTGDPSKDYLGDGMAAELINILSQVPGLRIPARTSTFSYKRREVDARQIAKDLNVGTILEGSVRSVGDTVRITAELIDAQTDSHLWSENYDRKFTDLFKLQDELAKAIVQALQVNLHGVAPESVRQAPPTQDIEAYNLYLQGWSLVDRLTEQNANRAIEYFQQAIARDPKFARAYAGLAEARMGLAGLLGVRTSDNLAAAERAAQKALSLDSTLANGHTALAGIGGSRGQPLEMEAHDRAAVALAANDGFIRSIRAGHVFSVGHVGEGLQEGQKAYALAPTNPFVVSYLAYLYSQAGQDAEALKYAGLAADLGAAKDSGILLTVYWLTALREKRYAEVGAAFSKTFDPTNPDWAGTAEVARLVFTALRDPAQRPAALAARSRLYPKLGEATMTDVSPCLKSGFLYAFLDALDVTYELANQCLDQRAPGGSAIMSWDMIWIPEMSPFRRDARFQALVTRLGMMEYYRQFGPPDDCELWNGKLTCH